MAKTTKNKKNQTAGIKKTAKTTAKRTVSKKTIKTAIPPKASKKIAKRQPKKPAKTSTRKTAVFPKLYKTLKSKPKLFKVLAIVSVVAVAFIGIFVAQNQFIASNDDSAVLGVPFSDNSISGLTVGSGAFQEFTLNSSYDHNDVKWSSSDTGIAHILSSTAKPGNALVTWVKAGTPTITATLKNGEKVSSTVNVREYYTFAPTAGYQFSTDQTLEGNVKYNIENGCSTALASEIKEEFPKLPKHLKNINGVYLLTYNSLNAAGISVAGNIYINCDTVPGPDLSLRMTSRTMAHELSHAYDSYYMTYANSGEKLSASQGWMNIYNWYKNLYDNNRNKPNYDEITLNDNYYLSNPMEFFAKTHAMYLFEDVEWLLKNDIKTFLRDNVKNNPAIGNGGNTVGSWGYSEPESHEPTGTTKLLRLIIRLIAFFQRLFGNGLRTNSLSSTAPQTLVHPVDSTAADAPTPDPINHGEIAFARWTKKAGNYAKLEFYSDKKQDGYSLWCYDSAKNKYGELFNANSDDRLADIKNLPTQVSSANDNIYSRGVHKYKNRDCYIAGYKYFPEAGKNIWGKPTKISL